MIKLKIRPPKEIINDATRAIKDPKKFSFSDYVNAIEKEAHRIYLEEEQKAIEQILLRNFDKNMILANIVKELAKLIATLSTQIANTRRARSGKSSEYILSYALKYYSGIENEVIGNSKNKGSYYPDIAIPSKEKLINTPQKAIALAVKRTLRERWREDINIFKHYPNAAFVCISESTDITESKIKDMENEGIKVLFLPDGKYKSLQLSMKNKVKQMQIYPLSDLPDWIRNIIP